MTRTSRYSRVVRTGVVAALAALTGCGDDDATGGDAGSAGTCFHLVDAGPEAGPEAGVAEGCPVHQMCDTSRRDPRCVCAEGYDGLGCEECERGWRLERVDGGIHCEPIPVDCTRNPGVCEPGGECKTLAGSHLCDCHPGYAGRVCSRCGTGFQDNDDDGTCEPDCSRARLSCPGRRECSAESGEAQCVCIEGYTGGSCNECAPGYRATGVGGCLPTCDAVELDCGVHGACSDLDGPPRCVCDVGYAGDGCGACADTHRDDGMGACIGDPPEGHTLLATATGERGEPVLGALDPAEGAFVPLTMLDRDVSWIAHDAAEDRLFGVSSSVLVEIDRHYGTTTGIALTPSTGLRAGLVYDAGRGVLYAADDSGRLVSIDATTGGVTTLEAAGFASHGASLAYDAEADAVLGASGTASRFEVDLGSGLRQGLPGLGLAAPVERLALAITGSGLPWVVADVTPTETERLDSLCREISAAMGYPVPDSVAVGGYGEPNPEMSGEPFTLSYEGRDPPLVMYGSYGSRSASPRVVRVATGHPDAVVCIATYEEPLHVVVEPDARFHFLILASYEPTLTLQVEEGFEPELEGVPPIRVRVGDSSADPSLFGPSELVRFYDHAAWGELGITIDLWSSSAPWVRPKVIAIDWASGAVFTRDATVRSFSGGLAPWRGEP